MGRSHFTQITTDLSQPLPPSVRFQALEEAKDELADKLIEGKQHAVNLLDMDETAIDRRGSCRCGPEPSRCMGSKYEAICICAVGVPLGLRHTKCVLFQSRRSLLDLCVGPQPLTEVGCMDLSNVVTQDDLIRERRRLNESGFSLVRHPQYACSFPRNSL